MSLARSDIVITVDSHLGETNAFRDRLPPEFRDYFPDRNSIDDLLSSSSTPQRTLTDEDMLREFRSDPDVGTNIDRRLHDMALEGVDGEVIFPNVGLSCSLGDKPGVYYHAWARAYNDYAWDIFAGHRERFKLAALLAVDDIDETVAEAERRIKQGFCTLFLPATVPWQPYHLPLYDPLWRLAEESSISVNFHIFSGNVAEYSSFVSIEQLDEEHLNQTRRVLREDREAGVRQLGFSVMGAAAGMAPIIELTGAGVLDRFPALEFVVTESDCGWLPWVLQYMDQMQERLLYLQKLQQKPSEYFRRQGTITISDDPVGLDNIDLIGVDRIMWGNDYPHDEGTFLRSGKPIAEIRARLNEDDSHKVLSGNAARLYGFDLQHLATTRDEVTSRLQ